MQIDKSIKDMTEKEKNDVVIQTQSIVYDVANKYKSLCDDKIEYEELVGSGWLGLAKALDTYDLDNPYGTIFSTYAYHCIRSSIVDYCRKEHRKINNEMIIDVHDEDDGESSFTNLTTLLFDSVVEPIDEINQRDIIKLIYSIADSDQLTEKEKFVFQSRISFRGEKKLKQGDIALLFNMTQAGVSKFEKALCEKIKTILIFDYGITQEMVNI